MIKTKKLTHNHQDLASKIWFCFIFKNWTLIRMFISTSVYNWWTSGFMLHHWSTICFFLKFCWNHHWSTTITYLWKQIFSKRSLIFIIFFHNILFICSHLIWISDTIFDMDNVSLGSIQIKSSEITLIDNSINFWVKSHFHKFIQY